jgi:hypothetical protein
VELKMPAYDSPLGKKQFTGQPMKETVIPDESGFVPSVGSRHNQQFQMDEAAIREFNSRMSPAQPPTPSQEQAAMEQEFREAREAKRLGRERLNDGAKRRIEMLIGMTRVTRSVDLNGYSYTLQTLKSRELREAITAASAFDGNVQSPFEIRKQLLARSLVQIAGMDADQFIGSSDLDIKLEFIEEMDHYLLGRLYDEYLAMVKEAREKYAIKNETDAKEVVEDLKK